MSDPGGATGRAKPANLPAYLALARELCTRIEQLAHEATAAIAAAPAPQMFADRVLIGLAVKGESSFRALIDDAEKLRPEAMHHLKTMAESFIYFHLVLKDGEAMAKAVFAEGLAQRRVFFRDNPDAATPGALDSLKSLQTALGMPRVTNKKTLEVLAKQHSAALGRWYAAVYRSACEPAHIGDLPEFMPLPGGAVRLGPPAATREYRAIVALDRGIQIVLSLLQAINETNQIGLRVPIDDLQRLEQEIRTQSQKESFGGRAPDD